MNSSTRLLMAAALSLTLVACAKKVKEEPPVVDNTPPPVVDTTPVHASSIQDVVDQFDGLTSLREALALANSQAGADMITFDATVFSGGGTIVQARLISLLIFTPTPSLTRRRIVLRPDWTTRKLRSLCPSVKVSGSASTSKSPGTGLRRVVRARR